MARYVFIGAGAIGGGLAGLLADVGVDVVAVARGGHADRIWSSGLTIRAPNRSFTVPIACVTSPDEIDLRPDDVLVATTKTHQLDQALRTWVDAEVSGTGGTAGELLPLVTALNGVSSEAIALRFFERVIGACVWMPATFLRPGEVIIRAASSPGTFHLAPVPPNGSENELLDDLEADWTRAGFCIRRPDDVMPWKYRKLLTNLGNVFQALVGTDESFRDLVAAAVEEGRRVLEAAGIDVVPDDIEAEERRANRLELADVPGAPEGLGGSSWQSLQRGTGDIETDYLNGEIARIARGCGVTAPINATVARLARRAAASGARPGDVTVAELTARLGL